MGEGLYASCYLEMWATCMYRQVPAAIPVICERFLAYNRLHDMQRPSSIELIADNLKIPDQLERIAADLKDILALRYLASAYMELKEGHEQNLHVGSTEEEEMLDSASGAFDGMVFHGLATKTKLRGLVPANIKGVPRVLPKIEAMIAERHAALNGRAPWPPHLQRAIDQAMRHIPKANQHTPQGSSRAAALVM